MDAQRFDHIRSGGEGCPSDLMLDRLYAGELPPSAAKELQAHVAKCAQCPQRMAARQAGFDAFPDVDPRPLLAGIHRRIEAEQEAKVRRFSLAKLLAILTPVSAAAAVAVFLMIGRSTHTDQPDRAMTREKGGLALHVFRQVGEGSAEVISGDTFRPGDRIRFVVDLNRPGLINVLGVESGGALYVAWPQGQGSSSVLYGEGKGQALPGAVVLDDSVGREMLYLVSCPQSVGTPAAHCKSIDAATQPSCPAGCSQSVFVLNKK